MSEVRDLVFRILSGFKGVKFPVNDSTIRLDESLRRWDFTSEKEMLDVMKEQLSIGDCFIDIGANFGLHTLYAASLVQESGKVIAIEPLSQNVRYLRKHISLNKFSNIEIIESAISNSKDQFLEFYFPNENFLQTGALKPDRANTNTLKVRNHRLDDIETNLPATVKLIKIDVEGAELEVLKGAENILSKMHPDLLIEIHGFALPSFGSSTDELLSFLSRLGYIEKRIQTGFSGKDNYFQSFFYFPN